MLCGALVVTKWICSGALQIVVLLLLVLSVSVLSAVVVVNWHSPLNFGTDN